MAVKRAYSEKEIEALRLARWRCRTDLGYLCREVLGYKDVDDKIHGPIMRTLQQFPKPKNKAEFEEHDYWDGKRWVYTPLFKHVQDLEGKRRRLILAHRGIMKCVSPDSPIRLQDGSYRVASDIRPGDIIAGQESETSLRPSYTTVLGVERQAPQPGYRINFASGRSLELSHEHPLRLLPGWVEAKDLAVGDRVAVHAVVPEPPNAPHIPDAELVGWFLGDGCCSASNITNVSVEFQTRICNLCTKLGLGSAVRNYPNRAARILIRGYIPRLKELGLREARSGDKFIPEVFFKADNASVAALLYGLFMSDGTLGRTGISLTSKSRRLATDTQKLLLRFNIWSSVREIRTKYKGEYRTYWACGITDSVMIDRFVSSIGWDKASSYKKTTAPNPNRNTVPRAWRDSYGKYFFERGKRPKDLPPNFTVYDISKAKLSKLAEALNDDRLRFLATDTLIWDIVTSVTPLGDIETLSIETDSKTLTVDDVVTHNTTLNLQAHPIQWIINYPSVALAIFQSNLDKSEDILKSVRHHFRYNEVFRRLFPEHCPHSKIDEWGLKSEFTTNARPRSESRREPTMKALSIDKENAGYHFDVMKFSDIVEPGTTKTDSAMDNTRREFSLAESLLVSPVYWIDVEGTRYTAREMYQDILDRWELERKKNLDHQYEILVQGCYKRQDPVTKKEQTSFTPDTLEWDYLLDENGKRIPWWAKDASGAPRFTLAVLEAKERDDPYDFSCQYLIKPQAGDGGKEMFPLTSLKRISLENYRKNVAPRVKFFTIALDSAQSDNNRSNHSVFTVLAWDAAGRSILVEIVRKKLLPNELVTEMFRLNEKYRPRYFVVEETQFITGLRVHIEEELNKKRFLYRASHIPWNVEYIKPDNTKSKTERIKNTLQPVFNAGTLLFVYPSYDTKDPTYSEEAVDNYEALLREFKTFPLGASDDIIDSLADHFQPKSWYGRLGKRSFEDFSSLEKSSHLQRLMYAQIGVDPVFSGSTPFPTGGDKFIPPEHFRPVGGG